MSGFGNVPFQTNSSLSFETLEPLLKSVGRPIRGINALLHQSKLKNVVSSSHNRGCCLRMGAVNASMDESARTMGCLEIKLKVNFIRACLCVRVRNVCVCAKCVEPLHACVCACVIMCTA